MVHLAAEVPAALGQAGVGPEGDEVGRHRARHIVAPAGQCRAGLFIVPNL